MRSDLEVGPAILRASISGAMIGSEARQSRPKYAVCRTLLEVGLARDGVAGCKMSAGGVGGAWPTVLGHSQVRHPGRSRLPGRTGVNLATDVNLSGDVNLGVHLI